MLSIQYRFGMEIRQLRYLVALAEERHFTRAAARANVAQPALSRQIRSLETELGVPLVDRTSRRVSMTDAGTRLVERARRILDEVEAARADVYDLRQLLQGRVRFGVSTTPGPVDVAALVAAFHRIHPGVELDVRDALSVELARHLRADRLDLALLTAIGEAERRQLKLLLVDEEPLVLCVGTGHPLAGRKRIAIRDLRDERFAVFHPGATIRMAGGAGCGRGGLRAGGRVRVQRPRAHARDHRPRPRRRDPPVLSGRLTRRGNGGGEPGRALAGPPSLPRPPPRPRAVARCSGVHGDVARAPGSTSRQPFSGAPM